MIKEKKSLKKRESNYPQEFINNEIMKYSEDFNKDNNHFFKKCIIKIENIPESKEFFEDEKHLFILNLNDDIKTIIKDDKLFFQNNLICKNLEFSRKNLFEINYFIQRINQLKDDEVANFFGMRKPRSTRKYPKEYKSIKSENIYLDEYKYNYIFLKIFNNKINYELLKRYFKVHDITEFFFSFDFKLMKNHLYVNYFTCIKDFEDWNTKIQLELDSNTDLSITDDIE